MAARASLSASTARRSPLRRYHLGVLLLLAPYLVGLLILILGPMAASFVLSLTRFDMLRPSQWIGVENFRTLVTDPLFWRALGNSLWFTFFGVLTRLAAALALALLFNRTRRGTALTRASIYLPTLVPDIAYALVWLLLLNPGFGPLNLFLGALGLPTAAWLTTPLGARAAVVIMWSFQIGEGFLLLLAARQTIAPDLLESATLDGAGAWATLRRIILPLMAPALLLLAVRDTALSFQASFVPGQITTETGPYYATYFLPQFIFDQSIGLFRYGYASAATVVMYAVAAGLIIIQFSLARPWSRLDDN